MPIKNSNKQIDEKPTALKKFRKIFIKTVIPEKDPILPKQLSVLSSDKISDLQLLYTAWRELTEDLLVEALSNFTKHKIVYDFEYEKKLLLTTGNTVKEKEAKVSTEPKIHELYLSLQDSELYYNLLVSKKESYDNCLTVISREITRRGNNP